MAIDDAALVDALARQLVRVLRAGRRLLEAREQQLPLTVKASRNRQLARHAADLADLLAAAREWEGDQGGADRRQDPAAAGE